MFNRIAYCIRFLLNAQTWFVCRYNVELHVQSFLSAVERAWERAGLRFSGRRDRGLKRERVRFVFLIAFQRVASASAERRERRLGRERRRDGSARGALRCHLFGFAALSLLRCDSRRWVGLRIRRNTRARSAGQWYAPSCLLICRLVCTDNHNNSGCGCACACTATTSGGGSINRRRRGPAAF